MRIYLYRLCVFLCRADGLEKDQRGRSMVDETQGTCDDTALGSSGGRWLVVGRNEGGWYTAGAQYQVFDSQTDRQADGDSGDDGGARPNRPAKKGRGVCVFLYSYLNTHIRWLD